MLSKNYNDFIFDFFGVISSEVAPLWFAKYFSQEGIRNLHSRYILQADTGEVSFDELVANLGRLVNISPHRVRQEWDELVTINERVVTFIRKLKKNYKIALCSDAPAGFLRKILLDYKLNEMFDTTAISSEFGATKQDNDIYLNTLNALGYTAAEVIFVDDNKANVQRAKKLGLTSILFNSYDEFVSDLGNDFDLSINS